jgi:hypothetical protein
MIYPSLFRSLFLVTLVTSPLLAQEVIGSPFAGNCTNSTESQPGNVVRAVCSTDAFCYNANAVPYAIISYIFLVVATEPFACNIGITVHSVGTSTRPGASGITGSAVMVSSYSRNFVYQGYAWTKCIDAVAHTQDIQPLDPAQCNCMN